MERKPRNRGSPPFLTRYIRKKSKDKRKENFPRSLPQHQHGSRSASAGGCRWSPREVQSADAPPLAPRDCPRAVDEEERCRTCSGREKKDTIRRKRQDRDKEHDLLFVSRHIRTRRLSRSVETEEEREAREEKTGTEERLHLHMDGEVWTANRRHEVSTWRACTTRQPQTHVPLADSAPSLSPSFFFFFLLLSVFLSLVLFLVLSFLA